VEDALPWLVVLIGGGVLVACVLLLGSAVGDLLFRGHPLHPLPAYTVGVIPKPAQFGRFAIALLVTFAGAGIVMLAPRISPGDGQRLRRARPFIVAAGQLAALAVVVWAWRGQHEGVNLLMPVRFHLNDLLVAIVVAAALALAAVRGWLVWMDSEAGERRRAVWIGAALLITALWLAPALFRSLNLAHAMKAVWYPMQFTFDDFTSVLNGRTPLVNYDAQYGSLLPFATEPIFELLGASATTFTALMWTLSLLAFMCVERALAAIARSERTALVLFVPLLAVSLFTLKHSGNERYYMANYYAVMPIRYVGPYVLFWCSIRQLRGSRPKRPALLFGLAGLVAINNTDFGVPALGACILALASARLVPRAGSLGRLRRLGGELAVGLAAAVLGVMAFLLLRTGSLPQLSRLTRYDQVYAITGFNMIPTPDAGLHIIIFLTFLAALIVAALRIRSGKSDRVMTGALVFSGTFGLGAGAYYMGRSLPEVLAALFSAWGLTTALLCLLAFRALGDPAGRARIWPWRVLPVAAPLVILGLFATTLDQFPAPWTQAQRLMASSHTVLFNPAPGTRFVKAFSRPGEHVALLTSLGHLISRDAGVTDVSPYSDPDGIVTYEQLDDVLDALRVNHGSVIYTGVIVPEVDQILAARGFRAVAQDPPSDLTMWRNSAAPSPHKE
jgi:hypothetical protein